MVDLARHDLLQDLEHGYRVERADGIFSIKKRL